MSGRTVRWSGAASLTGDAKGNRSAYDHSVTEQEMMHLICGKDRQGVCSNARNVGAHCCSSGGAVASGLSSVRHAPGLAGGLAAADPSSGSTPATRRSAFAKRLRIADLEARYFPEHVGPFVIFNSLAYAAPCDVLVRFDADDVMLDGYLRRQLEVVGDHKRPRIVHTWSILVDEQLKPTSANSSMADARRLTASARRPPMGSL